VEHILRLPGQVRPGCPAGVVPGGQVVGLLGVEHPERPQQRHPPHLVAVVRRVGPDFELLPEHDLD
jgi:hypothetical protein